MRILFVNDRPYLPQTTGGVEWNTNDFIVALMRNGIFGAVLCPIAPNGLTYLKNRIKARLPLGIDCPSDDQFGYPVFRGWLPDKGFMQVVKKWKPDAVVVQGSSPEIGFISRDHGIPTIFYFHMELPNFKKGGAWEGLHNFAACSSFLSDRLRSKYDIDVTTIRPIISRQRLTTAVLPNYVLGVGLQPIKGADLILEIARQRPQIQFVLLQSWTIDHDETLALFRLAQSLQNIKILKPTNDMRAMLRGAKVLLAPSRWEEAWGRVVTEAQINGIPVIASNRGGLVEAVGDGGTCLDPDKGVNLWIEEIDKLYSDSNYYSTMSSQAKLASQRPELQEDFILNSLVSLINSSRVN
ncbi:MAG: glycosyltransferase [Nitrosomonas sp.]|nr:glycosyltransferase [Nitrosomonas sp.]